MAWRRSGASSATGSSIRKGRPPAFAVILAGGSSTRLWPLARIGRPKPFLSLFGGRSLLRLTYERVAPLVGPNNILAVTGAAHGALVRRQVPELSRSNVILEETGRDTAASIALAALWICRHDPRAQMIVAPSDHWIEPASRFRACIRRGLDVLTRHDGFLTFGIRPVAADTGFGYIRPSGRPIAAGVFRARSFVEKPDLASARSMVRSGRYLWNSGIFTWRAGAFVEALRRCRPDVMRPLEAWARGAPRSGTWRVPASVLRRVTRLPVDRALLEVARDVLVMRASFTWSDVGTWRSLGALLPKDHVGNAGVGHLVSLDASNCVGVNEDGLTVFVGVRDIVAVRSGESVLVCHRDSVQNVREAVGQLGRRFAAYL